MSAPPTSASPISSAPRSPASAGYSGATPGNSRTSASGSPHRTLTAEVTRVRDILSRITKWWEAGETFGLATVAGTYRSAPRDPGAALAVSSAAGHEVIGSVSGGCVEGAVYELSLDVCQTGDPVYETYGVSDDDAFAVGLTCGGIIDIFVERVDQASFPELGEIAAAVERGEPVAVATVIAGPGEVGARRVIWARESGQPDGWHAGASGTLGSARIDAAVDDDVRGMLAQG